MKKFSVITLSAILALLCSLGAGAKVTLPAYFGDGMVLKKKSSVNMQGTADAGAN